MVQRFVGLLVTLTMLGSLLMPGVCRVTCASHDDVAKTEHHSCHQDGSPGAAVLPVAHACDHQGDGLIGLLELIHVVLPPAIVDASMTDLAAAIGASHHRLAPRFASSPPGHSALLTPLRV